MLLLRICHRSGIQLRICRNCHRYSPKVRYLISSRLCFAGRSSLVLTAVLLRCLDPHFRGYLGFSYLREVLSVRRSCH